MLYAKINFVHLQRIPSIVCLMEKRQRNNFQEKIAIFFFWKMTKLYLKYIPNVGPRIKMLTYLLSIHSICTMFTNVVDLYICGNIRYSMSSRNIGHIYLLYALYIVVRDLYIIGHYFYIFCM